MLNRGSILHLRKFSLYSTVLLNEPKFLINKNYKLLSFSPLPHSKCNVASIHTNHRLFKQKQLVPTDEEMAPRIAQFEAIKTKDKDTFLKIIRAYNEADKVKRGHLEFIYAAMKYMEDFGVEGDLETYKKLMDVFPKGKMIPKTIIQAEFYHFFRHQECALYILDKMEQTTVYPDREMGEIVKNAFGKTSHVFKKYSRMMYWMPKLKNLNPYQVPDPLPDDARELARLALKKMSVDPRTKIVEFDANEIEDSVDKTWIMSAQSPVQQKLISEHDELKSIFVEGPFLVWLRRLSMTYYVLRADPKVYPEFDVDDDDVSNLSLYMFGEKKPKHLVLCPSSVHEQEDGIIMGMCCTGTSSKDSLLSWIRFLRKSNPKLDSIPVLFKLKTSPSDLVAVNISKDQTDEMSQEDTVVEESPGGEGPTEMKESGGGAEARHYEEPKSKTKDNS